MSVLVLYYKVTPERMSSAKLTEQIAYWLEELPKIKQKQIKKLRQQKSQVLSLAGLQLLKTGITELSSGPFSLKQLQFPPQAKPFFEGDIDFNISHSEGIVCCVLSDSAKVGIDIELQREVKATTLNKFLNQAENSQKNSSVNNKQHFFDLWTKNEAIIKGANHGSIYNMIEIKHEQHGGHYQNRFWYTYPIEIVPAEENKEYTCQIACSEKIKEQIKVTQIYTL